MDSRGRRDASEKAVPRSDEEAARWYLKAEEQGHARAPERWRGFLDSEAEIEGLIAFI